MEIEGIDHVALAVADVERAANWYADVLGLERRYEGRWNGVPTFIGKGTTALALLDGSVLTADWVSLTATFSESVARAN